MITTISREEKVESKALTGSSRSYFEAAYSAFQAAAHRAGGATDYFYRIGGRPVRFRFAGGALIPSLTPALAHLATPCHDMPGLTVCVWDSASTGVAMPIAPSLQREQYSPHAELRSVMDNRIKIIFQTGINAFSMLDAARNLAIYSISDAASVPYWEKGSPVRMIFHWWSSSYARQMVHCAAIGTSDGGVLLAGKGGSGKSTTALACLGAGFLYAGDDFVLLDREPSPFAHSLYNSAKLNVDNVHRFPNLASKISNAGSVGNTDPLGVKKALLLLKDHYPDQIVGGLPVRAVLLPRVTGRPDTSLKPISRSECLSGLAPSTIFQLPGAGDSVFQCLAQFVYTVPAYRLEVGTELDRIPDVISGFLSGNRAL